MDLGTDCLYMYLVVIQIPLYLHEYTIELFAVARLMFAYNAI